MSVGSSPSTAERMFGKPGYAVDVQLFHDALAVGVDGFDAQVESHGNIFGGMAFGDELKHLSLSSCQE